MPRQLLVQGAKTFKVTIPDDAKITFGPWSPGKKDEPYGGERTKVGTLRIYQGTKDNIIACFGGVQSFRDLSMGYAEEVVRQEGDTIWKDDEHGYVRESRQSQSREWVEPPLQLAAVPKKKKRG
jgi:hypothetical protein